MSAAPAESMKPPGEDVGGPRARRGCSHPAVDLHGRAGLCPDVYVGWWCVLRWSDRPTEVAHREWIRGQGFRKRVRAGETSSESSIILTRRPWRAQRRRARRLPRSPFRPDSARSSRPPRGARRSAQRARPRRSSALRASSMTSSSTPASLRSCRTRASPAPRSARPAARISAKRRSSMSPVRVSVGERFRAIMLRKPARLEMVVDLRSASITMAQRPERRLDGVSTSNPASAQLSASALDWDRLFDLDLRNRSPQVPWPGGAAPR